MSKQKTTMPAMHVDSVLIRTRNREPPLFLHYDPPSGRYLVQECKRGACVFTSAKARECITTGLHLPGGEAEWTTEELCVTKRLPRDDERARKLLEDIKTLPGYTR